MLSICGEIILCDVSGCSKTSVFLILRYVSSLKKKMKVFFFFGRSYGWVAFLSYFLLEMWDSGVGKCEGSGKILIDLPF